MTIGLLSPVSRRRVITPLTRVGRLPDMLGEVVGAISRVAGATLLSAGIELASGRLRIELLGPATDATESRVRTALGGSERSMVVEWVPA